MERARRRAGELPEVGDEVGLIVVAMPGGDFRPVAGAIRRLDDPPEAHHPRERLRRYAYVMQELPCEVLPGDSDVARDLLDAIFAARDARDGRVDARIAVR